MMAYNPIETLLKEFFARNGVANIKFSGDMRVGE